MAGPPKVCSSVAEAMTIGDVTTAFGSVHASIGSCGYATINSSSLLLALSGVSSGWVIGILKPFGYSTLGASCFLNLICLGILSLPLSWVSELFELVQTVQGCMWLGCCNFHECCFHIVQSIDDCISRCDDWLSDVTVFEKTHSACVLDEDLMTAIIFQRVAWVPPIICVLCPSFVPWWVFLYLDCAHNWCQWIC